MPSVLTGYRYLAANADFVFVGAEGNVRRFPVGDLSDVQIVFTEAMGPLAADEEWLFVGSQNIRRMQLDGSGAVDFASSDATSSNLFVDGGYLYFARASSVVRVAVDAPPDTEPEIVASAGGSFYVKEGILSAPVAGGLLRRDIAAQTEVVKPYPSQTPLWATASDATAGYALGVGAMAGSLYALPQVAEEPLAALQEHATTYHFVALFVDAGRALYFVPASPQRRDYSSLYVYNAESGLRQLGNDAIPQPTGLVVIGNHAYVSALGTSGLAGDPHRLGTLMRFDLSDD